MGLGWEWGELSVLSSEDDAAGSAGAPHGFLARLLTRSKSKPCRGEGMGKENWTAEGKRKEATGGERRKRDQEQGS